MRVRNMISNRGNLVPNQFLIDCDEITTFQSYDSIIAIRNSDGSIVLDSHFWDYSRTTGNYRNSFLGESKDITQEKIASGEYLLRDLNP